MALSNSITNLYRKYPIAAVSAGLSLLVLAGYVIRYPESGSRAETLEGLRSETDGLQKNVANAAEIEAHVRQLKEGIAKFEARAVKESSLATNQQYFYRLEEQTGVKLNVTQGSESAKARAARKTTYVAVPFSVAADAPWPKILDVLRALETGGIEYRPISLRVLPATGTNTPPRVTLDLSLELLGTP